ncbi:hypothetical protein EW026_g6323 [Hermanssonia centrifuga]|uniref:Uncharacterized protein n=1 Tax=Hermanssonia centrifuga TaxID=98765 RepID=A0A4S4KBD6_9APHY|nr:hypothetical protein EW026_g6323 [Hermanssonia centrifuga]
MPQPSLCLDIFVTWHADMNDHDCFTCRRETVTYAGFHSFTGNYDKRDSEDSA